MNTVGISPYYYPEFDYQNRGLLFQFILEEFIHSQAAIRRLFKSASHPFHDDFADALFELITPPCTPPWNPSLSPLGKLHEHCLLLSLHSHAKNCPRLRLSRAVDRAISEVLKCQDLLSSSTKRAPLELIKTSLERLKKHVDRCSLYFLRCVLEYHDDENVMYLVLRRSEALGECVGNEALAKTLRRMYPGGLEVLVNFLSKRYTARGFQHIVPMIKQQLSTCPA